jgi:hypothetical protein
MLTIKRVRTGSFARNLIAKFLPPQIVASLAGKEKRMGKSYLRKWGVLGVLLGLLNTNVLAQGVVLFANQPLARRVFGPDCVTPLSGTQYRAELLYQNVAGQWVAHPQTADFFPASITSLQGYWNGSIRTLVGAGGVPSIADPTRANPVQMQIRFWDTTTGASYDSATFRMQSTIFNYIEEFDSPAGTDDKYMKSFQPPILLSCPEPSVFALAGVGVVVLLLRRRR